MSHISLRAIGKTAAAICLAVAMSGVAMAGDAPDRVVMQSPAKDAAVLAKMQGLVNNRKAKTLSGLSRTINDGVVIRKSTIKDGKIIIPPSGLYITVRSTNWHPFDNEPLTLAGKTYHAITDRYVRDVIRNVTMKKGQVLPSNANKSRGWELSSVENDTYGIEGGNSAVFKIVKTTGNYYGSQFPVYAGAQISNAADGSLVKGSKDPEGHTVPTAENGLSEMIYGSNIATVGRTHVIIDAIEGDSVKVRELATDSCSAIFVSPNEPVVASYGKGDTFTIGGGGTRGDIGEGLAAVSGSITVLFKDSSLVADALAGRKKGGELVFTRPEGSLAFGFQEFLFQAKTPEISGPAGIRLPLDWQAFYEKGSNQSALTASLVNTHASYADA